jgi:hypothetical protein
MQEMVRRGFATGTKGGVTAFAGGATLAAVEPAVPTSALDAGVGVGDFRGGRAGSTV